jgi:type IV secretion system protein VirD4
MEAQSPPEFSAVLSTVQQSLEWLAEPKARAAVSRSEVDFSALKGLKGESGAVIAVIMPLAYKETHKAIPRLAMQCAIWEMQRLPHARAKVLFEIDEAASLGRVERLPQWLAELRKYRVQWSLQFQNVGQPKYLYEKEWQTFQGNAGLKRFIGVRDHETAQEASVYCGRSTISVRTRNPGGVTIAETGRELRMADEVMRMPESEMIVFIDNLAPIRLKKTPYWNRPEFAGRFNRNPYHATEKRTGPLAGFNAMWGRLVYAVACVLTPHPAAALVMGWLVFLLAVGMLFGG